MKRKSRGGYAPVTIEALMPDGSWGVRNAFVTDNGRVVSGSMERSKLIDHAKKVMLEWIISYPGSSQLRISNGGR